MGLSFSIDQSTPDVNGRSRQIVVKADKVSYRPDWLGSLDPSSKVHILNWLSGEFRRPAGSQAGYRAAGRGFPRRLISD